MKNQTLTRIGMALAAVGVLLGLTTTALAGETRTWDDERYTSDGYAKGSVTITFLNKRAFDIHGYVEDKCPKDGYGAYMKTWYTVVGKTGYGTNRTWTTFGDANGCGNGKASFDPGPLVVPKGSKITEVRFELCYQDKDGNGTGAVVLDACVPQEFENWRLL